MLLLGRTILDPYCYQLKGDSNTPKHVLIEFLYVVREL